MSNLILSKEEATIVCNAIYRYAEGLQDDPAELERMIQVYDKVARKSSFKSFQERQSEKETLFFENLPKRQK